MVCFQQSCFVFFDMRERSSLMRRMIWSDVGHLVTGMNVCAYTSPTRFWFCHTDQCFYPALSLKAHAKSGEIWSVFARVLQALSLFLLFSCSRHELNKCTPAWISFMEGQLFMT